MKRGADRCPSVFNGSCEGTIGRRLYFGEEGVSLEFHAKENYSRYS